MPRWLRSLPLIALPLLLMWICGGIPSLNVALTPKPTLTPLPVLEPEAIQPLVEPSANELPTPLPSPTPLDATSVEETAEVAGEETEEDATEVVPTQTPVPVFEGAYEVYLSEPNDSGEQTLHWQNVLSRVVVTDVNLNPLHDAAFRSGRYIYYIEERTFRPIRINTAGYSEPVSFALPPADAAGYQLIASSNGDYLAWLIVGADGSSYFVYTAFVDGSGERIVQQGKLEPETSIELLRISNDGRYVFIDKRPDSAVPEADFPGAYDIWVIDTRVNTEEQVSGEPACGENIMCGAYISPDGALLARTLPADSFAAPIVVTNIFSSTVIGRFVPENAPLTGVWQVGLPIFTPGGELVYMMSYGPTGTENYAIHFVNLVTEEQRKIAELGVIQQIPVGWATDGFNLLTTGRDDVYETRQIDIRDGRFRYVSPNRYLGIVNEPPTLRQ